MNIKIHFFDKITSTNDIAAKKISIDEEFTIYFANSQIKGRGRNNREWYSPSGKNLYFSFFIKPDIPLEYFTALPILTGFSVFKTLKKFIKNKKIFLKWPNDILVEDRKISGILTEIKKENIIIGIGININIERFPELKGNIPTSLYIETGKIYDRLNILISFIKNFKKYYKIFLIHKNIPDDILKEINDNLFCKNKKVKVIFKDRIEQGILERIEKDGSIIISKKKIYAGDIIKLSEKNNT